jgi:hypothetical protein
MRRFVVRAVPLRDNRGSGCSPEDGIQKNRNWMVLDPQGQLVCLTVYKRGAMEVVRWLVA